MTNRENVVEYSIVKIKTIKKTMNQNQIFDNLTNLIRKAVQPSDFQIATTMVQFADLPIQTKLVLHRLIAKKKSS